MLEGGCFLTGTDTGVGKTHVAALLVKTRRRRGIDCVGMKPICCGARRDAELLHAASDGAIALNDVNPVWLRTPAAPYTAAMIENRPIDVALVKSTFANLRSVHDSIIVEGVGGWLVPITREYFVSDLAAEIGLPIVVVAANKLGALNHTLLTVEAIRARGLTCAGIILNHVEPPLGANLRIVTTTNRSVLESLVDLPILLEVAYGELELARTCESPIAG
jgi:dethiobiotin synthetase